MVEMARRMLKNKNLPNSFWAEAAVYLLNIYPIRAVQDQTPFEAWNSYKPSVSHLRIFGSICYALLPNQTRKKLDQKSQQCIFVRYTTHSKAYKLLNPINNNFFYK